VVKIRKRVEGLHWVNNKRRKEVEDRVTMMMMKMKI
jgi:hypothetical protein